MTFCIRAMRPDDLPSCLAVVAACWSRQQAQLADPEFRSAFTPGSYQPVFYVAEAEGRVVGTAFYRASWLTYGIYEMGWLCVLPAYRRRGIGSSLIERRLADIREIGAYALIATTTPDYFRRWEFREIAALRSQHMNSDCAAAEVLMIKGPLE